MILAVILMIAAVPAPVGAADAPTESEDETVKATVAPTEASLPTAKELGYAAYAKLMDTTVYTGVLGAIYTKKATTFRLWSPAAKNVNVCIYKTGSDIEQGAAMLSSNPMHYSAKHGTWYLTLSGDYKNHYYTYQVVFDKKKYEVVDPYAKAVGVNGNRGMIVDLSETDPEGWRSDSFNRGPYATDAVIWEVSVRDFSAAASSGVSEPNRGKFLAFTELETTLNDKGDIPTCVAYLKEMGVNYVQINPFYDFASIDEADTVTEQYNWGYDPKNYNVPEGSYSSDPYDGRVRIRECKQMIQALHSAGIGVIMDVVYNHTYYSEDSFFNRIVPDYYYRISDNGTWSNGSGCGNDLATERYMVSRYIVDSVTYWAQEYHIDGFRFDLMGLMDVNTMNSIRNSLDTKVNGGKYILMYGEAWNLTSTVPMGVSLANQDNMHLLNKRIGAFNDTGRDAIKGSTFNAAEKGFVQQGSGKGGVRAAIDADGGGWATVPNQCVNYASCHDNLTLYDKLTDSVYADGEYTLRRENLVQMNKLSATIVLMSQGVPFMLAGEEMARTKLGDENSYKSSVEVNAIDWTLLEKYPALVDYYKGLIEIRKSVDVLSDPIGRDTQVNYLEAEGKGAIAYSVGEPDDPSIVVAVNGSPTDTANITLPPGSWVLVADGSRSGMISLGKYKSTVIVEPTSSAVLIAAHRYDELITESDDVVMYVRYRDTSTDSTILEQKLTGRIGGSYEITTPDSILFNYNLVTGDEQLSGTFTERYMEINVDCEKYEGGFSSVTFRFIDNSGQLIHDSIVMRNRIGQQYYTPALPQIFGYRLDLQNLPDNGAGLYTAEPIEVIYRYYSEGAEDTDANTVYNCRANVIYMDDSGRILDKKSYLGVEGDPLEVTQLDFMGYRFVSVSDSYVAFSQAEANVIVAYAKKQTPLLLYVAIAGGVILLFAGLSFLLRGKGRRRKMSAMEIDD
jgi:type I pullulanase